MSDPASRAESQARTRRRLIAAAAEVFADRGYRGATVEEIARRAGYTVGAVYSNFSAKHNLFLAVLEDHVGGRVDEVAAMLERARTEEQLSEQAAADTTRRLREEPTWFPLFIEYWSEAMREPEVKRRFATQQEETRRRLAELIGEWAARNERELALEPAELAILAKALTNGLALEEMATPGAVDSSLLTRALLLLAGD